MTMHVLLLCSTLTHERLAWMAEVLRLHSTKGQEHDEICIYLSGDALYSLNDPDTRQSWSGILSVPGVQIYCDGSAGELRGIVLGQIQEMFPDRLFVIPEAPGGKACQPFWENLVSKIREKSQTGVPGICWLESESPYMHGSPSLAICCLSSAVEMGVGAILIGYLDGCHMFHISQNPAECTNAGAAVEALAQRAAEKNLPFTLLASRNCAAARGYLTWDDAQGTVVSLFAIKKAHIRDLNEIASHIREVPVLLAENAGCFNIPAGTGEPASPAMDRADKKPLLILITHSPYSSAYAYGGLAFAAACAHRGISTEVIFCEDGAYAAIGEHRPVHGSETYLIPDLLVLLAKTENLRFYVLAPSLQMRGISRNPNFSVLNEIDHSGMADLLFGPPHGDKDGRRRIVLF